MFNSEREELGVGPIYVHLLCLPLHFWFEDIFSHIGNTLRTFLDYEKSYIVSGNMSLARILVHLNTQEGLEEKITFLWKHFTHILILEYEGVPFR